MRDTAEFAPRCVSIDLEVGKNDTRIHQFAAVRGDTGESFIFKQGQLAKALDELDEFAEGVAFDVVHLAAAKPDLRLLRLPRVDTLRINPLAFPRNPYHHLVKHYQDGQLKRGRLNDPELDARLTLEVFRDQYNALKALGEDSSELLLAWHWLTTVAEPTSGLNSFFTLVRDKTRPPEAKALAAVSKFLSGRTCTTSAREVMADVVAQAWPLAYRLAWLSVAGGNSVMPPWVRHQFPEAGRLVRDLRDTACTDPACEWCRERHDARKELTRWFGFPDFRPESIGEDGRPLQRAIVEAAMAGRHVLGILPTGAGKSLCYQIPALSRFDKIGGLTVVISPLVALMADQVAGLEARGITSCVSINGLLSMPERADALDRVRLGDVGILIASPEQLRSRSLRKVLEQREIGAWVLDEAHCLSKWGHDFRPDYRYVGRFIKKMAGPEPVPPVLCLTATAKPDVVADILGHFYEKLEIDLELFDGGASRTNLDFVEVPTTPAEKYAHIHQILMADLPAEMPGGAIVYCATKKQTEEVAHFLREKGLAAGHFHAGLPPETKKNTQAAFIRGGLRVIAATNAFGMGIDKPDVRLVIHADIPGSLENYLQEAGRAGRDREAARCVLLYTQEDVERQFSMSARSRLTQREIQAILKALRNLDRKKRLGGEVVATAGEILADEEDAVFQRDQATDDTRVRTAISWLEEAVLLSREENQVQVFPSSLRVATLEEAQAKLVKRPLQEEYRRQLLALVEALIEADADEGISTDELMGVSGLSPEKVRAALHDLESLGIASNDTALTAFIHAGVERSSQNRFREADEAETALIQELRLAAPDMGKGDTSVLHLRHVAQHLKDAGLPFWRLRETQTLIQWLRGADSGLIDSNEIKQWLDNQDDGPWWAYLLEAVDEYGLETGGAELPLDHFVDWLAEWGREMRRRQTGLLLLTAHRAKGLEFDHVAVLDGGWDRIGKEEDTDAPRRLYYVAMTRARQTLFLARLAKGNTMLASLPQDKSLLLRDDAHLPTPPMELSRRYWRVSLKELYMDFAGLYAPNSRVHQAISALRPGDPIRLVEHQGKWELRDVSEKLVGRMSQFFALPEGMVCAYGSVVAVIRRKREDVGEEFQERIRSDGWELVVPELVFMPVATRV